MRLEYPTVYLWNHLGQKWCFGDGAGLATLLRCLPPVLAFLWVLWFLQHKKGIWGIVYMRFGLDTRSRSHVVSRLVVAAWCWVVSAVLWSFCAGRGVETAPQGWICTKGFITAGFCTIHAGEIKAWFERVLDDLKWTNYNSKTEVSGNLSSLFA